MKLTLETLEVLDAIDRRGSFAAAADELHRVPSAVTYSVQQAEEALRAAAQAQHSPPAAENTEGASKRSWWEKLLGR